jgi:tRNA A-37 threonylcarbamoyl transferase component Bud32
MQFMRTVSFCMCAWMQRVFGCVWLGRACICKERFLKRYRHPQLDAKLSSARMTQEVRCMTKVRKQVPAKDRSAGQREAIYAPTVFHVDDDQRRIYMERIDGVTVKDKLQQLRRDQPDDDTVAMQLAAKIGRGISDIHATGCVAAHTIDSLAARIADLIVLRSSLRVAAHSILHGDLTTSNLMVVPTADDSLGKLVRRPDDSSS